MTGAHGLDVREEVIPLPSQADGYRQVLLLGTTGAGKTTLVRQLLGTDPSTERFPSTSAGRTTIADTEIILRQGAFQAAVTFFPRAEVVRHLEENVIAAAIALVEGRDDAQVRVRLLDHEQQRFRFSYVLGRPAPQPAGKRGGAQPKAAPADNPFARLAAATAAPANTEELLDDIDMKRTHQVIDTAVHNLAMLVRDLCTLPADVDERQDTIAKRLTDADKFGGIVGSLLSEIDLRFRALAQGEVKRGDDGWPLAWTWESEKRKPFLKAVNRFSSNYSGAFGHLLSPLVDGIRVAGPFHPAWREADEQTRLVLVDGQGLGHTSESGTALSTSLRRQIADADSVVLVDNAVQPMLATTEAALRAILTTGAADKLLFCFTHFEQVHGDNLPDPEARALHVRESGGPALSVIRRDFGGRPAEALQSRLNDAIFAAALDRRLGDDPEAEFTKWFLDKLIADVWSEEEPADAGPSRPVYEHDELRAAVLRGLEAFHLRWRALLGIQPAAGTKPVHFMKIRALCLRIVDGQNEYGPLKPVADLSRALREELYRLLESPARWTRSADSDGLAGIIDPFVAEAAAKIEAVVEVNLIKAAATQWTVALELNGSGVATRRAHHISEKIFDGYAPADPSPANNFAERLILSIEQLAADHEILFA